MKQMPWRSLSMEKTDRGKRGKVGRRRKEEEQGRSGDGVGLQVAEGWPGWPGSARSPAAALGGGGLGSKATRRRPWRAAVGVKGIKELLSCALAAAS